MDNVYKILQHSIRYIGDIQQVVPVGNNKRKYKFFEHSIWLDAGSMTVGVILLMFVSQAPILGPNKMCGTR
jgi:hypothetical protein